MIFTVFTSFKKQSLTYLVKLLPTQLLGGIQRALPSNSFINNLMRLSVSDRDVKIVRGIGAGLKFNGGSANPDFALGDYELPLQEALASHLKPGGVFYDIGANIGFFSILGAKLVGHTGKVYAFEPVPDNAAKIHHNARLNNFSQITVIEKAVSGSMGEGQLLLTRNIGGHTLASVDRPPDVQGSMAVALVSIDELIAREELTPPTLVKIDVEGAELDVLQGMKQTLAQYQPLVIYEIDAKQEASFERKQQAVADFLQSQSYQIQPIENCYPGITWKVGHAIAFPLKTVKSNP
ncbi:FkbM family methyltransferase [Pleurocapsales cyanobacterium LEGE 06147]|nr:FkbM family methyltransferase [Pleurocapsales cyanobacterium LEGE 06147]